MQVTNCFSQDFVLRAARHSDLDDITHVHIVGFTEEPLEEYCYPLRHDFPEDYAKWAKRDYERYLEQPTKFVVHVLEAPIRQDGETTMKLIGHAVWNIAVRTKALPPDSDWDTRRDANKKHCAAFIESSGKRFQTYFAEWEDQQINLHSLVVHPDFRRRGGGTMLVNWGIQAAKEKAWAVTLCASPMGSLLYHDLGFKRIATEMVRIEGEEESMSSFVMVLEQGDLEDSCETALALKNALVVG